jgi:hypothetical protein
MRDWTGHSESVFKQIGARSKSEREENDFYATCPKAMELLLEQESFSPKVWECAVGEWHLADVLIRYGYKTLGTDIVKRTDPRTIELDFLAADVIWSGDIITNPPYKYALEFTEKALSVLQEGKKLALFLKLIYLEGKRRKQLFEREPFETLYVMSSRINCAKNGDFDACSGSAIAFAWYVWRKGFRGTPVIKWI